MIVSVNELIRHMGGLNLNPAQWRDAELVLRATQDELEAGINAPVEVRLFRERIVADEMGIMRFGKTPVLKVIDVQDVKNTVIQIADPTLILPPEAMDPDAWKDIPGATGQEDLASDVVQLLDYNQFGAGMFGWSAQPGYPYLVRYVAGYTGPKNWIKKGILEVASRNVVKNHDETISIKGGTMNMGERPELAEGWTEDELERYSRIRRRVIV